MKLFNDDTTVCMHVLLYDCAFDKTKPMTQQGLKKNIRAIVILYPRHLKQKQNMQALL
jgi:hypothetical protein